MGYSREIYRAVEQQLTERRRKAETEAQEHRAAFYRRCPPAEQIEKQLAATAISAARAVLSGKDAREQLTHLKQNNQMLQNRLAELLKSQGYPEDYLEPHYACPDCKDTGYQDGILCSCMKKLLREESYRRLNALTPLSLSTFESFSLDYYSDRPEEEGKKSPRAIMENIYTQCRRYAASFSPSSPNLILQGGTGLGKTHMSLAIANLVIQKGYGVVYCSVNNIINQLEREHFGRDDGDSSRTLQECDLLILDDLGTEFRSAFSCAEIYNLVNTRLMTQKPTIISTNLTMQELQERYTERFASRIMGNYARFSFCGRDNRLQKLLKNSKSV